MVSHQLDDLKKKKACFKRMYPNFHKKATELSILCGNAVGYICYDPEGNLHAWPESKDKSETLPKIIDKFNQLSYEKQKKHASDLTDFYNMKNLPVDELKRRLASVRSTLAGIKQKNVELVKKKISGSSSVKMGSLSEDHRHAVSQIAPTPLPSVQATYNPGCSSNAAVCESSQLDYSLLPPLVSYEDFGHTPFLTHDPFQDLSTNDLLIGSFTDDLDYNPGCSNNGGVCGSSQLPPSVSYEDSGHAPFPTHAPLQYPFGHDPFQDLSTHYPFIGSFADHIGYNLGCSSNGGICESSQLDYSLPPLVSYDDSGHAPFRPTHDPFQDLSTNDLLIGSLTDDPRCSSNDGVCGSSQLPPLVSYEDSGYAPFPTHAPLQDPFGHDPFQDLSTHDPLLVSFNDHLGYNPGCSSNGGVCESTQLDCSLPPLDSYENSGYAPFPTHDPFQNPFGPDPFQDLSTHDPLIDSFTDHLGYVDDDEFAGMENEVLMLESHQCR